VTIAIFSVADTLSGGNFRNLNVLKFFPEDEYILLMPKNRKEALMNNLKKFIQSSYELYQVVERAFELKNYNCKTITCFIKYGYYVSKVAEKLNADLLYFPNEHAYLALGFRMNSVPWTELLQLTPVVGALTLEDDFGFRLFAKNMYANFGYNSFKIIRSYVRFLLFSLSIRNTPVLSVSRSIPYELNKLGVRADIKVLSPSFGIDPCPYSFFEKKYDLVFFARITPEKGIFEFLKIVNYVRKKTNIRAVVMGFSEKEMSDKVISFAKNLGILENLEFKFNVPRSQTKQILASAKLMIYPTKLDSFSLTVLESLSCGTPVIAYNIPAIRFNYRDTKSVIKIKPLSISEMVKTILDLLENEGWKELSKDAIQFTEPFKWENAAKAELKMLHSLVE